MRADPLDRLPPIAPPTRSGLRIRVIHNPRAARRRHRRFAQVLRQLHAAGHEVEVVETARAGDAAGHVRSARRAGVDLIAIAGGDGTFNDALQGVSPDTPPLGLIPLGTANVLAHELGIGTRPARIVEALTAGRVRSVLPGEIAGRRFMMMAGVGLDAQVVASVPRPVKARLGKAAYVLEVIRTLLRWRGADLRLRIGDEMLEAGTAIFSRGRHYGGRFVLAPHCDLFRPHLQLIRFPRGGALSVFLRFLVIPSGQLVRLGLAEERAVASLEIVAPAGEPIQADGDIVARVPATIRLCDQPVRLCVPAG
ncbi:YegS/Rv2252/BmrU family lipid kinase [Breoghania sp. JC706]|uniref:diacylglycerol/lipid kinase family protein n=1 Tax=Breoghania sp. JC706 TaxID=3117732 RepID=UPI00300BAE9B